ncbi:MULTISPECIES: 30S ribosomal protein S16 [Carboxydothermus]|uniref:Small ribosomal subunit protein bS16 n=2 Tax=Carboxydothermus TaxID=129957 RepID=RS16_CARHZ|nr:MULTISPECIES: 30S ribosomal protein S16 [Carboxydothermus]Q3AC69.1 RecName: Full=Small ribosomal subunit protein bS16; AltName: Full=30S ribosomal protein S16 [Carboxydothermus hydrogenoformans Z-2901]ABB15719.1 ribosomal protein S16 [Carboxydothermus hydrogenoformans Z-2901]NYE58202.1 small subunit ribosomal protein S16 [Carboxydothermus ferrireducens DSM 11255]
MAVKIRLKRMGAKNNPFYRVVVADARSPRDGRVIDEIGYYDPVKQPAAVVINEEKALDWLKKGAQLTETARALFRKAGVLQKFQQK